jgi:hypothetical protein
VSAFLGYGLGEAPRALWNGSRIVETIKHHLYQVKTTYDTWTLAAEDLASKLVQVYYLRSRYDTVYGMAAPRHNSPTHAPAHSLAPHQNSSLPSRNAEDQSIRTVDPQDQLDRRISKEMDAARGTPAGRTSEEREAGHTASDVTIQMPLSGPEAVGRLGGGARGGAGSDILGLNGVNLSNEIEQIMSEVCVCVGVCVWVCVCVWGVWVWVCLLTRNVEIFFLFFLFFLQVPFDIMASVFVMDAVKGAKLPGTQAELEKAYVSPYSTYSSVSIFIISLYL